MATNRIVIVSNRVGLSEPGGEAAGGLVTGIRAALAGRPGMWFGWSGKIVPHPAEEPTLTRNGALDICAIDFDEAAHRDFYLGFANSTLWPLCHFRVGLIDYDRAQAAAYDAMNERFARILAPLLKPDDLVWIHDYHLIPLGRALRRLGVQNRLGFFLHIPLPPPRVLATLPGHRDIFSGFLAYDVVGMQTQPDIDALRDYCRQELGCLVVPEGTVYAPGRRVTTGAFPIGIDPDEQRRVAEDSAERPATRRLVSSLSGRRMIIGVDRLDYSKGLAYRMRAFGELLARRAEWLSQVTYLQIAAPSRIEIERYRDAKRELERLAGKINGRHAEFDWMPVRYLNRSFKPSTLAGFYRAARVGLVTPLRDGMNLVAKEYVASQDAADPGVLILSPFAGAAEEMDAALIVNPLDTTAVADAIHQALLMPLPERRERWLALSAAVARHDAASWQRSFCAALAGAPLTESTAANLSLPLPPAVTPLPGSAPALPAVLPAPRLGTLRRAG